MACAATELRTTQHVFPSGDRSLEDFRADLAFQGMIGAGVPGIRHAPISVSQVLGQGYFSHVSKAVILDAVRQFAPAHITRLSKLKKTGLATEAERLVAGTGWMPAVFEAAIASDAEPVEATETVESETPEDAGDVVVEAHALTA